MSFRRWALREQLTDEGRFFHERARNILAEMEAAQAQINESRAQPRGRLRISAPITFGSRALAPWLAQFMRQYPTNRTVDLIDEGFDIAFRTEDLSDSGWAARRLAPHRLLLCAAPDYLKRLGTPRQPENLRKHECLVFAHTSMRTQWSFKGPGGPVTVPIAGRFSTDSGEALPATAVAGPGIILQPSELLAEDIESGRLTRLLSKYEPRSPPTARALRP